MDENRIEQINYGLFRIARHLWAIMLIVAEMLTGVKPNWRNAGRIE